MKESYVINSPAKLNLLLNVDGKCSNGYHAISTYFKILPQISDYLLVTWEQIADPSTMPANLKEAGKIFLENLEINGFDNIASKEENLIYKAIYQLVNSPELLSTCELEHIKRFASYKLVVNVDKRIPVQGGLGGGSSNGSAILKAVAHRFFPLLTPSNLVSIAQRVGADCSIFVYAKSSLAYRIGDLLFTPQYKEFYLIFDQLFRYVERAEQELARNGYDLTDPLSFYDYGSREFKISENTAFVHQLLLILLDLTRLLIEAVNRNPNIIPDQALDYISLAKHLEQKYSSWLDGYFLVFTSDYKVNTKEAFNNLSSEVAQLHDEDVEFYKQISLQSWTNMLSDFTLDVNGNEKNVNSFAAYFFSSNPLINNLKEKFSNNLQLTGTGATCYVYVPRSETLLNWYLRKFKDFCLTNEQAAEKNLQMYKIDTLTSKIEIWSA
ncbi:hypothetical protein CKF54_06775 [Psittacicella hinzii]|uniref:GHMP kinase N-terminal domain-containing protein n=1 Tax=Psittacicella hinzii TaxID=2028575 RepID=A0A3A1XZE7_9GAMM|nr:hypothetical protein [Psittacicella hinzii]RIY31363.1 hypothetical protein CKF54_06775 [Psittacicella hinzii]